MNAQKAVPRVSRQTAQCAIQEARCASVKKNTRNMARYRNPVKDNIDL
jgi:hypothetical protein